MSVNGMFNAKLVHMLKMNAQRANRSKRSQTLRLGYVRLLDAAPIIVADSLGFFRDEGLDVRLSREVGWATIRDKIAFGELDVAQALSPLAFALQLGINVAPTDVVTGLVLNCNGNAITLSTRLRDEGVNDGASLRRYTKNTYGARKLVFGVVSLYSSHHYILCRWLEEQGIRPHVDVIITVLPPEQMVRNILANNIDGYCVGEPWNSMAIEEGFGWCVATSDAISAGYPEKVLIATERLLSYQPEVYFAMIRALYKACAFCESSDQRPELLRILSKPEYLNCRPRTLSHAFSEQFPMGFGRSAQGSFIRFRGDAINCPDRERGQRVLDDLCRYANYKLSAPAASKLLSQVWRASLHQEALAEQSH